MEIDVSIIIVSYNTKELIRQCLESVYQHSTDLSFEVIVVDNASTDGSQIMIKKTFCQVKLIESHENLGFGKANNLGAKVAEGKYLFLLNSDTILLNNAIAYLYQFFESNLILGIGAIGSLLLDSNLKPIHSSGKFPSITNSLIVTFLYYFDRSIYIKNRGKEQSAFVKGYFEVDYVTGADLFISNELFKKVGGFDPEFFLYYEETDLQMRIKKLGLKSLIIDSAKIVHFEGGSNKNPIPSLKSRLISTKSMLLYFKKNKNVLKYFIFRICYLILRLPILLDKRLTIKDRMNYITFLIR